MPEQTDVRDEVVVGTEQEPEPVPVAAFGVEIEAVVACNPEVEPANAVVDTVELPVAGSIADNSADIGCNQDTAGSIVGTAVAVDTIAL